MRYLEYLKTLASVTALTALLAATATAEPHGYLPIDGDLGSEHATANWLRSDQLGCAHEVAASCAPACCPPQSWGLFVAGEATFFKYHRSDGVRFGTSSGEIVGFDYAAAPRVTLGYANCCFGGIRARWWEFDQFAPGDIDPQGLDVETTVIDFEWFDTFYFHNVWGLELSAGLRYSEFRETMLDGGAEYRINDFDGLGGVFGLELNRRIWIGSIYARARGAVLQGDKYVRNDNNGGGDLTLNDVMVSHAELAVGYQISHQVCRSATLVVRGGVEWQHWFDYSSGFANTMPTGEDFAGPSDVGFAGATVMAGLYF